MRNKEDARKARKGIEDGVNCVHRIVHAIEYNNVNSPPSSTKIVFLKSEERFISAFLSSFLVLI
jgi:hypothetical protein